MKKELSFDNTSMTNVVLLDDPQNDALLEVILPEPSSTLSEKSEETDEVASMFKANDLQTSIKSDSLEAKEDSLASSNKNLNSKQIEKKIRRGSWLGYSFFMTAFSLAGLYLISVTAAFLSEIVLIALWFLIPALVVTAIILLLFAFFRGKKYLKSQEELGETRNTQIARFHLVNKIVLGVCVLAVIAIVTVFLLALSSI